MLYVYVPTGSEYFPKDFALIVTFLLFLTVMSAEESVSPAVFTGVISASKGLPSMTIFSDLFAV